MDTHDRKQSDAHSADIASVHSGRPVIDTFGIVIFFVVLVEIALIFGLNLYQQSRVTTLDKKLTQQKQVISSAENSAINRQIDEVLEGSVKLDQVLGSKVKWSTFYTLLNAVTPKNVRVTGLTITESGTFNAEGTTSSLNDLARLLVAWQSGTESIQTPFSDVTLNSNGYSESASGRIVTFTVSGNVIKGVLK